MTVVLDVQGVTAGYGPLRIVNDVDLEVSAGEIVCLLGPNGTGKTTTLLAAVGQIPLMSGRVAISGHEVSHRAPHRIAGYGVAFVPDDRGLFLQLSVIENLRLVHPWGCPLDDALDLFPALRPLVKQRAGLLSGGEQQMVALAKAVLARPQLLLIDELTHGLAPMIARQLFATVRELAVELGAAVLLVEQSVDLALGLADRAVVMRRGEIVMGGTTDELSGLRDELAAHYLGA